MEGTTSIEMDEKNKMKLKGRDKTVKMAKVRKFTVDRHILKVVDEAIDLKRDLKKFRYVKHEMRPPLTSTYIHFDGLRQVHNLQRSLQYDVMQSEKNDVERANELDDVKSTCESYKKIMLNFTNFIDQNREKRERTVRQMDENIKIIKEASIEIRRLIKAAQDLLYVRDTMQTVIDENSNYVEFLNEVVSKSTRYKSIEMLVNRHEALITTRNRLIDRYLQLMTEIEMAKLESLKDNYNNVMAMVSAVGKLQQVDYMLTVIQNEAKAVNDLRTAEASEGEEQAAQHKLSVRRKTSFPLNPVATFMERLTEKLILAGMTDKSLHQRTLPQQVAAVRSEYFRKLDIIRNYRENLEAKCRRRDRKAFVEKRNAESKIGYDKRYNYLLDRMKVLGIHQQLKHKRQVPKRRARTPTLLSDESHVLPGAVDDRSDMVEEPSTMDDIAFDIGSITSAGASSDEADTVSVSGESFSSTITRRD